MLKDFFGGAVEIDVRIDRQNPSPRKRRPQHGVQVASDCVRTSREARFRVMVWRDSRRIAPSSADGPTVTTIHQKDFDEAGRFSLRSPLRLCGQR